MKRIIAAIALALASGGHAAEPSPEARAQVEAGKQLFETTCASSTCHGSGGVGAQGPKLTDRSLSLGVVREAITKGRSGTAMPPFADVLEPAMLAQVTAYVLAISAGGRIPDVVSVSASAPAPSGPMPARVPIGKEWGYPAAGAAVFFDATRAESCRVCHSFRDNGGPVGPDLATLSRSPTQIYLSLAPGKTASAAIPALTVTAKSGETVSGIKRSETADAVRIVDVSSIPPVTRTFLKSELAETVPATEGLFDHATLSFGKQDLLDVAAFLGVPPK